MRQSRRLRWPDALIVAASLVLGLAGAVRWARSETWEIEEALGLPPTSLQDRARTLGFRASWENYRRGHEQVAGRVARFLRGATDAAPILLGALTLGAGLATFRRPRALGRRSWRSIGVQTTLLASFLIIARLTSEYAARRWVSWNSYFDLTWREIWFLHALAISAFCVVMRLGGVHWRPVDARDRLGRWVGWGWVGYLIWAVTIWELTRVLQAI
jgi:hypothetical protein